MRIEKINNMSFKEKCDLLQLVFREYHKAKMILEGYETKNLYPALSNLVINESSANYQNVEKNIINQIEKRDNYKKIVDLVDYLLDSLDEKYREMIVNEFKNKNKAYWWIPYYSKSTYYRVKAKALDEMLFYLLQ